MEDDEGHCDPFRSDDGVCSALADDGCIANF